VLPSDTPSVTDGQTHVGWIHERAGNYAAFDDACRHLGDFATLREALRVIPSTSTSQQKETSRD
jgi:hypothetical protein